jgi:N-acetylglucosaminyldiphosphoundecaprenol N-acetyl-beta-D-mannosaminyltransferase
MKPSADLVPNSSLAVRFDQTEAPLNAISETDDKAFALIDPAVRQNLLGVPVDCLTLEETLAAADRAIQSRRICQHVCLNVSKFTAMRTNPELDRDVRSSHIVSIDGMGIVWAARLLGINVPERVPGIAIMEGMIRLCAIKGYRPFLLGASPRVLQLSINNIRGRFPGLELAGSRDGYFRPEEEHEVVNTIKSSRAECLFIGMPTPRKERFLARYSNELGVPFIMGVGGGLDILAGHVRRAPPIVQNIGLEWLFRTVQEPLRLGPRYLRTNAAFAGIIVKELAARFFARWGRPPW